ncbi:restriction endonuclease [Priestia aryabhattai]|uniref:Sau3AI family type II restriction endonuclease n=1 Tax=Priestia TaxID=2800373 RepID=UPI001C8D474D|nr:MULTISPECIES: Sau3AI family type II restriction endonuclease [Priestia]MBY0078481.1 restriction endonuclease [Priestia aryabhattai]MCQ9283580.1 Sau3AI family type II restriction endonuclease [Priestia aryabhattai]MDC7769774.1 Sau3AI family type II restriction endonuclease [Priestia megaterium]UYT86172.1 Sau3AI family type II restriction endonuclease [Priestia megaterium]
MEYLTTTQLMKKAQEAEGKSFKEIDITNRLSNKNSKGGLGQVIEESLFGYKINSNAKPDFEHLNVELKVTPFKRNKNGKLAAKERLVLNIINYMEEINYTFETSSFWKKNQQMLLMFYEWLPYVNREDLKVFKSVLFTFPESDLEIIKHDWEIITKKIRDGKAHELSEGDTNYLGACSKGANKQSLRFQPNSTTLAMQRAFSLKQSYMTALVRKHLKKDNLVSLTTSGELKKKSLEDILISRFSPYKGLSAKQISENLGVAYKPTGKSFIPLLISSLLGIKGTKLENIEEFSKANIQFKTIRLEPNGKPEQSMSFKNIDFQLWTNEEWENSYIRKTFYETKFLFVIFEFKEKKKDNPNREPYFKGIKLWNMPVTTIENEIKQLWEEVNRLIATGVQIEYKPYGKKLREYNNFPKKNFNGVTHIRPKGQNGEDKVTLPNGQVITKQCYWLNDTYIASLLKDLN